MVAVYKYPKGKNVMKSQALTQNMKKKMVDLKQSHTFKAKENVIQVSRRNTPS